MQIKPTDITNAKPVYNRSEIMRAAHASVKFLKQTGFSEPYAELLADRLRYHWHVAKEAAAKASMSFTERHNADVLAQIADLPNKPFQTRIAPLEAELRSQLMAV